MRVIEEGNILHHRYDGNDRLIEVVTEKNGQVTSTVSYVYDAEGNQVQATAKN